MKCAGRVYIVGAGPGDPELITVKGLKLIREADVIVYDRLIPKELLDEAKPDAKLAAPAWLSIRLLTKPPFPGYSPAATW